MFVITIPNEPVELTACASAVEPTVVTVSVLVPNAPNELFDAGEPVY
jgi:hypothetical protein